MFNIDRVSQGDILVINNSRKKAISKVKYISEKSPEDIYYKIILEDHSILVVSQDYELIYYGTITSPLVNYSCPFPNQIQYENENYSLITQDYQIVIEVCFGNPLDVEGEVYFADYICNSNSKKYISLAVVSRTNMRADVIAHCIDISTLQLEEANA